MGICGLAQLEVGLNQMIAPKPMDEGTIATVLLFPRPWPPAMERELILRRSEDGQVSLSVDTAGRLVFSIRSSRDAGRVYRFQPIRIEGAGRAILVLSWSKERISLRLNGQELSLDEDVDVDGQPFLLKTSDEPVQQRLLLEDLDPTMAKSETEYLFLATVADVEQKLTEGSRYSLIRAAGLLRQLFLDATPLVHEVNRTFRQRITFQIINHQGVPPVSPQAHWLNEAWS
jgi:hypothetical protein